MRNGMSVKEIYEALDERDGLKSALMRERQNTADAKKLIHKICDYIDKTAMDYIRIADATDTELEDEIEFRFRAAGLLEAMIIIRRYSKEDTDEI